MLKMNCWSFKDLLDSYLSQELAVETNHAMLRHTEQCATCRREMAARRQLRERLRRGCLREKMSRDAYQRLHARLCANAFQEFSRQELSRKKKRKTILSKWAAALDRIFASPAALPAAISLALLLLVVGVLSIYMLRRGETTLRISELSAALFDESAGDHRVCAVKFHDASGPVTMPADAPQFDPAYESLDRIAEIGARGLQLRAAHICLYEGRRFAHLVYTRDSKLISLLVTERDTRALKLKEIPDGDGSLADLQRALRDRFSLGAYQTARHVVLVVSDLPENENDALARQLAVPVAAYLRQRERTTTTLNLSPVPISKTVLR